MESNVHRGIGIMSGTSLDGLDLAMCEFWQKETGRWGYAIKQAYTINYTEEWKHRLSGIYTAPAEQYFMLHSEYGRYIAQQAIELQLQSPEPAGFIASHGHTVFHRPALGFSTQLGCGATIAAHTGLTTVCDFRSLDVANGGQGAPLVPIGDQLLFGKHSSCLNLGGIANISFDEGGKRKAFDICIANMALNHLSQLLGKAFDESGNIARKGHVNKPLLEQLNTLTARLERQSIGREFFESSFLPLLHAASVSVEDQLATCVEHMAWQVSQALNVRRLQDALITGGGAYNLYFLERLRYYYKGQVSIPDDKTICFKEALIFAFLGLLRLAGEINTMQSVTGAKSDSIGGAVYVLNK